MRTQSKPAAVTSDLSPGPRGAGQRCLLCGGTEISVAEVYAGTAIQRAWGSFGVKFSPEAWSVFDGVAQVELFRCGSCGFKFCDPRLAGQGLFYAELERQKAVYYPPEVPEFIRTLAWARQWQLQTLLDVGCGAGAFLDRARAAGLRVTGVELNLQAAAACQARGHVVHTRSLDDLLANKAVPPVDLVTIFQVLEHVSNPVPFVREAVQFLKPGGYLSVAVPNEGGIYRICPKEPHQWPPHHITRWRDKDLRQLGQICQLEVVHVGCNRLLGQEAGHFWKVQNELAAVLGERPLPGGKVLPAILEFFYRKLGFRYFVSGMGTSVYALYRRPTA